MRSPHTWRLLLDARADAVERPHVQLAANRARVDRPGEYGGAQSRHERGRVANCLLARNAACWSAPLSCGNAESVFEPLARDGWTTCPSLTARVFLRHRPRVAGIHVTSRNCCGSSPTNSARRGRATRHPEVYYDPRALAAGAADRATWHAKCVRRGRRGGVCDVGQFHGVGARENVEAGVLRARPSLCGSTACAVRDVVQSAGEPFAGLLEGRTALTCPTPIGFGSWPTLHALAG